MGDASRCSQTRVQFRIGNTTFCAGTDESGESRGEGGEDPGKNSSYERPSTSFNGSSSSTGASWSNSGGGFATSPLFNGIGSHIGVNKNRTSRTFCLLQRELAHMRKKALHKIFSSKERPPGGAAPSSGPQVLGVAGSRGLQANSSFLASASCGPGSSLTASSGTTHHQRGVAPLPPVPPSSEPPRDAVNRMARMRDLRTESASTPMASPLLISTSPLTFDAKSTGGEWREHGGTTNPVPQQYLHQQATSLGTSARAELDTSTPMHKTREAPSLQEARHGGAEPLKCSFFSSPHRPSARPTALRHGPPSVTLLSPPTSCSPTTGSPFASSPCGGLLPSCGGGSAAPLASATGPPPPGALPLVGFQRNTTSQSAPSPSSPERLPTSSLAEAEVRGLGPRSGESSSPLPHVVGSPSFPAFASSPSARHASRRDGGRPFITFLSPGGLGGHGPGSVGDDGSGKPDANTTVSHRLPPQGEGSGGHPEDDAAKQFSTSGSSKSISSPSLGSLPIPFFNISWASMGEKSPNTLSAGSPVNGVWSPPPAPVPASSLGDSITVTPVPSASSKVGETVGMTVPSPPLGGRPEWKGTAVSTAFASPLSMQRGITGSSSSGRLGSGAHDFLSLAHAQGEAPLQGPSTPTPPATVPSLLPSSLQSGLPVTRTEEGHRKKDALQWCTERKTWEAKNSTGGSHLGPLSPHLHVHAKDRKDRQRLAKKAITRTRLNSISSSSSCSSSLLSPSCESSTSYLAPVFPIRTCFPSSVPSTTDAFPMPEQATVEPPLPLRSASFLLPTTTDVMSSGGGGIANEEPSRAIRGAHPDTPVLPVDWMYASSLASAEPTTSTIDRTGILHRRTLPPPSPLPQFAMEPKSKAEEEEVGKKKKEMLPSLPASKTGRASAGGTTESLPALPPLTVPPTLTPVTPVMTCCSESSSQTTNGSSVSLRRKQWLPSAYLSSLTAPPPKGILSKKSEKGKSTQAPTLSSSPLVSANNRSTTNPSGLSLSTLSRPLIELIDGGVGKPEEENRGFNASRLCREREKESAPQVGSTGARRGNGKGDSAAAWVSWLQASEAELAQYI